MHVPRAAKPAMAALWSIDAAMEAVVARNIEPMLARIKLAWWREQLEALDEGPPPAEPRLRAVAETLLPRGLSGRDVAELEAGWATLLEEQPDLGEVQRRGLRLFAMSAKLIDHYDPALDAAGALFGLMSAARHGFRPPPIAIDQLKTRLRGVAMPRRLRPVTGLAALAARDARHSGTFEAEGSRRRAAALLVHRWFGRVR